LTALNPFGRQCALCERFGLLSSTQSNAQAEQRIPSHVLDSTLLLNVRHILSHTCGTVETLSHALGCHRESSQASPLPVFPPCCQLGCPMGILLGAKPEALHGTTREGCAVPLRQAASCRNRGYWRSRRVLPGSRCSELQPPMQTNCNRAERELPTLFLR
jgi:hypothetical protein